MKSQRAGKRCPDCPEQCFCDSSHQLPKITTREEARGIVPWLWLPNCKPDHAQFHVMCRQAGVDFRKQSNKLIGQIQALKAQLVGMWMVVESMEKYINEQLEK